MYQFSRAIYSELAPHILAPPPDARSSSNHEHVLRACEAVIDADGHRSPLLRASRAHAVLDIRSYFPMSEQGRVHRVVDRYIGYARTLSGRRTR